MSVLDPTFPIDQLAITTWADPVVDQLGHDPRSNYVERFWLGILGPSTTLLLRRLANGLDETPDGFSLDLPEAARSLGLGAKGGKHSPFMRAIARSCQFGMARFEGSETLAVRRKLPPLSRHHVERLPEALQMAHRDWQESELRAPTVDQMRKRARHLALSLFELGEDFENTERQLHRWKFHPAMAQEAAAWAYDRHQTALTAIEAIEAAATPPRGDAA